MGIRKGQREININQTSKEKLYRNSSFGTWKDSTRIIIAI